MVRAPCCDSVGVKRGPWTAEEDEILVSYIQTFGHGNWRALPKKAGLNRCGKSCRLRWTNYLRPDIKRGNFTKEEEDTIIRLHAQLGNRWSAIAAQLPGRTDNEIKNVWHTYLKKRLPEALGAVKPEAALNRRSSKRKDQSPSQTSTVTPATLVPKQQQPSVTDDLSCSPEAEDEPATSSSSSWMSAVSECSGGLMDLPSVDVSEFDESFWIDALAMETAPEENQPAAECTPCGGGTTGTTACYWPDMIATTENMFGGATSCRPAEIAFEDGTDFWLGLLVEAGNLGPHYY